MEQHRGMPPPAGESPHADRRDASWDAAGLQEALGAIPAEAADVTHGLGVRFAFGDAGVGQQSTLEIYAERGVVRYTNLAEGVQVTLIGQAMPPSVRPEGVVFEQPRPTRWLSVGKDGSATLFVDGTDPLASSQRPAQSEPTVSPAVPSPATRTEAKEPLKRGRIQGNLAYDPVFKITSRQKREIAEFVVAEHYTNEQGDQATIFHRCVAFNTERKRLADAVRDQARQGDEIVAHGSWHEVPITYRNGTQKVERQLWVYGVKVTPKDGQHRLPDASRQ